MSTLRVSVNPEVLQWAINRSGKDYATVANRFSKLNDWVTGVIDPTLKQLEDFAHYTYTPVGTLFLESPPVEKLSLPDFRYPANASPGVPSANLLDVISQCEIRQDWYRNYLISIGEQQLEFVASCEITDSPWEVASRITEKIGFDFDKRASLPTWDAALTDMIACADSAGILVMRNGVVGSNNKRPLDPEEFSGFALVDEYAPLVFVNGKDSRSRQMFTLAHELAHIWLGESGVSMNALNRPLHRRVEKWCDRVAAELLVPMDRLKAHCEERAEVEDLLVKLSRLFKVSTLVVLRRLYDGKFIEQEECRKRFDSEIARLRALSDSRSSGGGDYYRTQISRTGKRFTRAVVYSALEGQTLYRDAFAMLGVKKQATFNEMARNVGVPV